MQQSMSNSFYRV